MVDGGSIGTGPVLGERWDVCRPDLACEAHAEWWIAMNYSIEVFWRS